MCEFLVESENIFFSENKVNLRSALLCLIFFPSIKLTLQPLDWKFANPDNSAVGHVDDGNDEAKANWPHRHVFEKIWKHRIELRKKGRKEGRRVSYLLAKVNQEMGAKTCWHDSSSKSQSTLKRSHWTIDLIVSDFHCIEFDHAFQCHSRQPCSCCRLTWNEYCTPHTHTQTYRSRSQALSVHYDGTAQCPFTTGRI